MSPSELAQKKLAAVQAIETTRNFRPDDDAFLWQLRVICDAATATVNSARFTVMNMRSALNNAEKTALLAEQELEHTRANIRERYELLKIPVPAMFHVRGCVCETCSPFRGNRGPL